MAGKPLPWRVLVGMLVMMAASWLLLLTVYLVEGSLNFVPDWLFLLYLVLLLVGSAVTGAIVRNWTALVICPLIYNLTMLWVVWVSGEDLQTVLPWNAYYYVQAAWVDFMWLALAAAAFLGVRWGRLPHRFDRSSGRRHEASNGGR